MRSQIRVGGVRSRWDYSSHAQGSLPAILVARTTLNWGHGRGEER